MSPEPPWIVLSILGEEIALSCIFTSRQHYVKYIRKAGLSWVSEDVLLERGVFTCPHLDTWWHGDVEVTQDVLRVLILSALPQERQEASGVLVAVPDLV